MRDEIVRGGGFLITIPDIERFFSYVDKTKSCWLWTGTKTGYKGYGSFSIRGKEIRVHIISYLLHKGIIPIKLNVCHTCDIPNCVNPEHLWLGTQSKNIKDMFQKGRGKYGESSHLAVLKESDVIEIRKCVDQGATYRQMADRFNVSTCNIRHIVVKSTWKHI